MIAAEGDILIVEDLPDTQQWLSQLVAQAFPAASVQVAGTLADAKQWLSARPWSLLLVDLSLPDGSGTELIQLSSREAPQRPVIVTTIYDDDDNLFAALSAGACGYLLKSQSAESLLRQLVLQQQGFPPMSPSIARRLLAHFRQQTSSSAAAGHGMSLTTREEEVLRCIGQGMRTREVATALGLAEYTVTTYIRTLYEKLNIHSRAEAALEAARRGLLES